MKKYTLVENDQSFLSSLTLKFKFPTKRIHVLVVLQWYITKIMYILIAYFRERLIHLLAVKPYKKLELLPRLHKGNNPFLSDVFLICFCSSLFRYFVSIKLIFLFSDGMKEKDKKIWMNILREVSELKNNCFELKRSVWNDVMEDWPFYSEGDKAALRRRKPQNLTPPVSDTGSTSSGHSPSSTTPASPPQITNPLKRQSYYDASNESKKKRVSHPTWIDWIFQTRSRTILPPTGDSSMTTTS